MKTKWKILLGLTAVLGLALAQQPIQLQTVNGGGAVALGHGTAATALRVELPTDGTGLVNVAQTGTWTVQPGNTANTTAWLVTTGPTTATSGALTKYHNSSAAAANIKASAGNLYGLVLGNSGTVPCWLQLFNNAGTPTAGTSVIDSILVQAGVTVVVPISALAYQNFATGIAYAGATADSGATTTGCTTTFSVSAYYQ